jgi:hypothetical protein
MGIRPGRLPLICETRTLGGLANTQRRARPRWFGCAATPIERRHLPPTTSSQPCARRASTLVQRDFSLEPVAGSPTGRLLSRTRVITTAAACMALVISLAVWRANGNDGPSSAPSTTPTVTNAPPVRGPQLLWPPRVLLDDSWTAIYADEDPTDGYGEIQFVRAGDGSSRPWGIE